MPLGLIAGEPEDKHWDMEAARFDLVPQVVAHPHRVMHDDDTGLRTRPGRRAHVRSELTRRRGDHRFSHCHSIAGGEGEAPPERPGH